MLLGLGILLGIDTPYKGVFPPGTRKVLKIVAIAMSLVYYSTSQFYLHNSWIST